MLINILTWRIVIICYNDKQKSISKNRRLDLEINKGLSLSGCVRKQYFVGFYFYFRDKLMIGVVLFI